MYIQMYIQVKRAYILEKQVNMNVDLTDHLRGTFYDQEL